MTLDVPEGQSPPAATSLSGRLAPALISAMLHLCFAVVLLGWGFGAVHQEPEPMVLEVQWEQPPPPAPEPQAVQTPAPVQPQLRAEQPRRTTSKPSPKSTPVAVSTETSREGTDKPSEMVGNVEQESAVSTHAPAVPSRPAAEHLVPLIKVDPTYPPHALLRRIEGAVTPEFGVTAAGTVADIQIVQAQPSRLFEEATKTALARWQFVPDTGQSVRRGRIIMEFRVRS
ncbi:TonB family protein [Paramagnetospirillum kuznetsovii]|nr:TonB family protein [Paramagnetospirillum kuznetsovii]